MIDEYNLVSRLSLTLRYIAINVTAERKTTTEKSKSRSTRFRQRVSTSEITSIGCFDTENENYAITLY